MTVIPINFLLTSFDTGTGIPSAIARVHSQCLRNSKFTSTRYESCRRSLFRLYLVEASSYNT
ncbi:hypothetical protein Ahy_B05g079698 isoform C [Arachis hypogaea]|uniref:Uncharacterized protein n=1 Tax=Arachis hypogaea TaxID=3818 RepID=A0A444ZAP8_ARAHY|nr:hypothetical protein Ahy_B05g079698 isoform C [Arachis hypogaea]